MISRIMRILNFSKPHSVRCGFGIHLAVDELVLLHVTQL